MQYFIPYVAGSEAQTPIQVEKELALAFLVGLSREERGEPTALMKVQYPFKVYTVDDEKIIFDLLGYSESDKHLLLPKDLSEIIDECDKIENSEDKKVWLNTVITLLSEQQEYATVSVKGLVEQGPMVTYLLEASGTEEGDPSLFEPLYTKRKFTAMQKKLKKVHAEILERIESTEQTIERLETIYGTIKKENNKQQKALKKESKKRLDALLKEKDKAYDEIDKKLKKENKAIKKEAKDLIKAKQKEIDEINKDMKKLEKSAAEGDRDAKREIGDRNRKLKQLTKEIQEQEKTQSKRVSENENRARSEKTVWESKVEAENKQNETELAELIGRQSEVIDICSKILEKAGEIETRLNEDLQNISRLLEIKYEKGETIYLPFYLFRYGDGYGYNPPVMLSFESGVTKTLKLLFAGNLAQRLGQKIQPQTTAFNDLLERVVGDLVAETPLSRQIEKAETEPNMLKDREIIGRIEVGLYRTMERQWISEKDYIAAQGFLVHRLDMLNGGSVYKEQEEDVIEPVEASEITAQAEAT